MRWSRLPWWPSLVVALAISVSGCRATPINYTPSTSLPLAEAKYLVLQVLEEQPRHFTPAEVDVTYDKMTTVDARTGRKTVVYFGSVSRLDLHRDRRGNYYFVRVFDTAGGFRFRVWTLEAEKGKRFMDGVRTLAAHARARKDDAELRAKEEQLRKLREITGEIEEIKKERADEQRKKLELEPEESTGSLP